MKFPSVISPWKFQDPGTLTLQDSIEGQLLYAFLLSFSRFHAILGSPQNYNGWGSNSRNDMNNIDMEKNMPGNSASSRDPNSLKGE